MRNYLILLLVPVLVSCGVKDRTEVTGAASPAVQNQDLPAGVWVSKNKTAVLRADRNDFKPDPQFKVSYTVLSNALVALDASVKIKVKYWMPSMPSMPVTPAVIVQSEPTKYLVTYDISMGKEWEFILSFEKDGKEIDSFTYRVQVPE